MKAILKFNMEEPEDKRLHAIMMQAESLYLAVWEILRNDLRTLTKYDSLQIFNASDMEYLTDTEGNPITQQTPIDKISGDGMAEMIKSYLFRKFKEENVDLDL